MYRPLPRELTISKSNIDGSDHSDTATYDWNGTAWVAQ